MFLFFVKIKKKKNENAYFDSLRILNYVTSIKNIIKNKNWNLESLFYELFLYLITNKLSRFK